MISQARARARAARRRHLQQRQTVIFGTLIAAMLVVGLAAGAMWVGILPSPISVAIESPEDSSGADTQPCPPDGATYVPLEEISANVLNGTTEAGLASRTTEALADRGVAVGRTANADSAFEGVARLLTGPKGLPAAFTLAELFDGAEVEVDSREDETVDVILGSKFESLRPKDEISIDPDAAIPAPTNCTPVSTSEEDADDSGDQG